MQMKVKDVAVLATFHMPFFNLSSVCLKCPAFLKGYFAFPGSCVLGSLCLSAHIVSHSVGTERKPRV